MADLRHRHKSASLVFLCEFRVHIIENLWDAECLVGRDSKYGFFFSHSEGHCSIEGDARVYPISMEPVK
jgi:hypothetical protein